MGDKRYNLVVRLDYKFYYIWDGGNIYLGVIVLVNDILEKFQLCIIFYRGQGYIQFFINYIIIISFGIKVFVIKVFVIKVFIIKVFVI